MSELYRHYISGFYQEVYDTLVAKREEVFEPPLLDEALLIGREMMRRVRYNLELLVSRLHEMNYRFGEGFWRQFDDLPPEEIASLSQAMPILGTPTSDTQEKIQALEHLTGELPLSLRCWYEEVGSVNLIGLFASSPGISRSSSDYDYGTVLDPLFVYSLDTALQMVQVHTADGAWNEDPTLSLSPDNYYKYSYSGSGAYSVSLPGKVFDVPLLLERHDTTFVNYLRLCCKKGGFPGLEIENRLMNEQFSFLTHGLLPF